MGRVTVQGLRIAIEQPCGSIRSGKGADGKEWSSGVTEHRRLATHKFPKRPVADANFFSDGLNGHPALNKLLDGGQVVTVLESGVGALNAAIAQNFSQRRFGYSNSSGDLSSTLSCPKKIDGGIQVPGKLSTCREVEFFQSACNRMPPSPHLISNFAHDQTSLTLGFDLLQIQTNPVVKTAVLRGSKDGKVFGSVIRFYSVDVMHMLIGMQISSRNETCNQSVLFVVPPASISKLNNSVLVGGRFRCEAPNLPIALASRVAKKVFCLTRSAAGSLKRHSAVCAFRKNHSLPLKKKNYEILGVDRDFVESF